MSIACHLYTERKLRSLFHTQYSICEKMSFDCDFKVGPRLGFLGVGTMNSAIIEGILTLPISKDCVSDNFSVPIFVSPRGSMKVASLLKKHGSTMIHVCKDNQDLLDKSDVVFIGVRPEQVDTYYLKSILTFALIIIRK